MPSCYTLKVNHRFSSAHFLRDYDGPCARMHGHDYRVEVEVQTHELNHQGLGIDCAELLSVLQELAATFDHRCINDIPPFTEINPSAENIAAWFYHELQATFTSSPEINLLAVTMHETDSFSIRYTETPHTDVSPREANAVAPQKNIASDSLHS